MKNTIKNQKGGIIEFIVIIIGVLLLLNYFHITISEAMAYFHITVPDIINFFNQSIAWLKGLVQGVAK